MDAPAPDYFPPPGIGPERLLDRMADRRQDKDWIAERITDPNSRFMLFGGLKLAVQSEGAGAPAEIRWLSPEGVLKSGAATGEAIFMGCDGEGRAVFAVRLSEGDLARRPDEGEGLKPLVDLRSLALQGALAGDDLGLAGVALALAAWHDSHRCCGRCGGHTRNRDAGWRRRCWACGQDSFPRMDPAVIVLVTDGERCLLGHERRFREKFYSVLAGYVEPGENIEQTVRREIGEEAGIEIGDVAYLASQPWPFPHSLMIGCWAEALTTELSLARSELLDVRWFTRADARAMIEGRHQEGLTVPAPYSIAHSLIKSFADKPT